LRKSKNRRRRRETLPAIDAQRVRSVRRTLLAWFYTARREFFWREPGTSPFAVLLSEILLARTRAESVEPVVRRLVARFPEPLDFTRSDVSDVEEIVRPLGLHRTRARLIVRCATHLAEHHDGRVPSTVEELMTLPYVGRYAATAVASVVFGQRAAVLDANVARVYQRFFGLASLKVRITDAKHLWALADRMVSPAAARDFNWAILDLGGLVCKARNPACRACPLKRQCVTGQRTVKRERE
jgi:A/G-specific adenine glycosylase